MAEYGPQTAQGGTQYLTSDHLGSIRVVTDSGTSRQSPGVVLERHDYQPFGEELRAGVNGRTSADGYPQSLPDSGADLRFTGKERDQETGLDYFEARYFSAAQGRFTSPDEFKGGIVDPFTGQDVETNTALPYADITDPQTLNKYAYVRNNPLRYTDPDGHCGALCIWAIKVVESPPVQAAIEKASPYLSAAGGAIVGGKGDGRI